MAEAAAPELAGELLEDLARAAHRLHQRALHANGYVPAETPDDGQRRSASFVAFDDLPEVKKNQNRGTVRHIPAKLARMGCTIVPARIGMARAAFTDEEIETLARIEHERWLEDLGAGWRQGHPTDLERRIHEAYVPWDQLSEQQKEKDRDMVCAIPEILAEAGYAIARTRERGGGADR